MSISIETLAVAKKIASKGINVQSDWNETTTTDDAYIKNKPPINAGSGSNSIAGNSTGASGNYAHAEGHGTIASGLASHSEGYSTRASGIYSHAEGSSTVASGDVSHAEGAGTISSGVNSHAEGEETVANHRCQHVFGRFNILDPSTTENFAMGEYIEIVGNGNSSNNRSNARTLDTRGNEVLAGKLTVGTGPTNNLDVATKKYVDDALNELDTGCIPFPNSPWSGAILVYDGGVDAWIPYGNDAIINNLSPVFLIIIFDGNNYIIDDGIENVATIMQSCRKYYFAYLPDPTDDTHMIVFEPIDTDTTNVTLTLQTPIDSNGHIKQITFVPNPNAIEIPGFERDAYSTMISTNILEYSLTPVT